MGRISQVQIMVGLKKIEVDFYGNSLRRSEKFHFLYRGKNKVLSLSVLFKTNQIQSYYVFYVYLFLF